MTLPGGVQETAGYDGNGAVTRVSATGPVQVPATTTLNSTYLYGYNATGWVTSTTTLSGTDTITHDALGRLTDETGPQVVAQGGAYHWTYDNNGNMKTAISDKGVTETYSYNSGVPNELQAISVSGARTVNYTYDAYGNTTSITTTGAQTDTMTVNTRLFYDAQARPITITLLDKARPVTVTIGYNAAGERARYTETMSGTAVLDEHFQYRDNELSDVAAMTATLNGNGTVQSTGQYTDTYVYNQDGTPLEFLRRQGGVTNRYWYILDGGDNVVAVTDVNGKVVDRYGYDAWGEPVTDDATNETVPQPLRYGGYWYDARLQWYWVSVRYYDPEIARWLQPDPSETDGVRTYTYVDDDPVDFSDPTGLSLDFRNPPSWLTVPTVPSSSPGSHDPLNAVMSANSDIDAATFVDDYLAPWKRVAINPPDSSIAGCPVNSLSANVGKGWTPQALAWRKGGCSEFSLGGNHARAWPQTANGRTAWFFAVSKEHDCLGHPGGYTLLHIFHCIDANGFNQGRDDYVADVKADNKVSYAGLCSLVLCPPLFLLFSPPTVYRATVRYEHEYPSGTGSDGVHFDGNVALITVKKP